ncbi:hypothetical protein DSO57_1018471 [Entomophthora muscae]|uniref:Uncharacterized protein n=1 Tax=Entomophthora muscae TaxID=34485 RepID=A0ACC2RVB9_9FUNG|nr:hypothetical protein DSO57_1018471 [Entomophthora muscae]
MYLVRVNKDPQVTVIPESLILPDPSSPFPQTPPTAPVVSPQLLVIGPASSSEETPPLALLGTLLHNFWWPSTLHQMARRSVLSCLLTPNSMVPILLRIG